MPSQTKTLTRSGLPRFSRSKAYHAKGIWALKKKNGGKFPAPIAKKPTGAVTKVKDFGKKGEKRTVTIPRAPSVYEETPRKKLYGGKKQNPTKIRDSLQAGTVAILLSGKFRGKRVVVVKRLDSGLVLVTGPYKVNGVPLKRVNPAYLIATSTKVDFGKLDDKNLTDSTFARPKNVTKPAEGEKKVVDPARLALQKAVDGEVTKAVKSTPLLAGYLAARFTLNKGQYPHALKF